MPYPQLQSHRSDLKSTMLPRFEIITSLEQQYQSTSWSLRQQTTPGHQFEKQQYRSK